MGTALGQNTRFKVSLASSQDVSSGTLWGWGWNNAGAVGDGTTVNISSPIQIGLLTNWSSAYSSVDGSASAAIKTDGTLWTWGQNNFGGLGNNTTSQYSSPIQVGSLTTWSKASIESERTFAIKTDGTLWGWGRNFISAGQYGLLGLASGDYYSSPVQIGALTNWSQVSAGQWVSLAIKTDGTLWGCGYNAYGVLPSSYSTFTQIGTLTNWSQVSIQGAQHMVAIKTDGTLWASGTNTYGQVGNGTTTTYTSPVQIGSATNWSKISVGLSHSAAIKTDGTLWAWGFNSNGQLGNGTTTNYSSPIQVGSLTTWSKVSCGNRTISAIKTDGSLWSWGQNAYGQLANKTTTDYSSPIQIGTLTNWGFIAAGYNVLAIPSSTQTVKYGQDTYSAGSLWVTGGNDYGQLGNGTTLSYSSPIQVGYLTNWSNISSKTTCFVGIKTDGTLWTCGRGALGTLGNGTALDYSSPIQVGSLTNWSKVTACGYTAAAIKTDGTLWTWGRNNYGQMGNGATTTTFTGYSSPVQVGSLTNWSQVACGYASAAVKIDGTLWTWGFNTYGGLGNGNTISYSSPVQVGSLTNWSKIDVSQNSIAAIKTDGTLWAWGRNEFGQLGNGTVTSYSSPIQVGSLTNWSNISIGYGAIAAIKTDGTLWAWGYNLYGCLGNGTTIHYSSPVQVGSLTNWNNVVTGTQLLAVKTDGTLWGCGYNISGQLGNGTTISYSSPIQIGSLSIWNQIATGFNTTYFIPSSTQIVDRTQDLGQRYVSKDYLLDVYPNIASATGARTAPGLWAWGSNAYGTGEVGNGTTINYSSPIQIGTSTNWKQVSARIRFSAAIKTDGTLWTWGSNMFGGLGIGSTTPQSQPIQVGALTNWKQISCGYHTLAVKTDGTLWACGYNVAGQLGNGTTAPGTGKGYSSPIQIGALTNWKQVSNGGGHSAAVKTDGTLWTWGGNNDGQLGNGTTTRYSSPIQIGALTNWKQVATHSNFMAAVKIDGTLWSWGDNQYGQLGDGTTVKKSSPIQIGSLTNWKQVATAYDQMAAVKTDGTLWTCGYNGSGVLGLSNDPAVTVFGTTNVSTPVQVAGGYTWSNIDVTTYETSTSTSSTSFAYIKNDGSLWVCGYNNNGSRGNGTTINYSSPIQVGSLTNWKQISYGGTHMMAIKTDGTLWAVGGRNNYGGLGNGTTINYSSPIQIGSLTNWSYISSSLYTTHAVKTDGTLWAWGGYNNSGQLGNGTVNIYYSSPIQVGALTNWSKVKSNGDTTFAIKTDGTLWGWGKNYYGILGNGTSGTYYSSPVQIGSLTNWKYVHVSAYAAHAVKTDGTMWTWGHEASYGNMGVNATPYDVSSPVQVGALTTWKYISGSSATTYALKTDGTLWSWGYGGSGDLGNGKTLRYSSPIQVGALTNWVNVIGPMAVANDGSLWTWGDNTYGQLGAPTGYLGNISSPVQVGSLTNWKQVNMGGRSVVAIKTDGTLWVWGRNTGGTMGNGTTLAYSSPIQVGSLNSWKSAACGYQVISIQDGYY